MIPLGGYSDHSNLELGAIAAGILTGTGAVLIWAACTYFGAWLGELTGYPATGGIAGFLGIPILAVLINGWRHEEKVK